jgi:hypothetical protein
MAHTHILTATDDTMGVLVMNDMAGQPKKRPGGWTDDHVEALIAYWSQGKSNSEIAKIMGRTSTAISMKAHRLNLPAKTDITQSVGQSNRATIQTANKNGKVRPCLCCNTRFFSTGSGNRVCDECKSGPEWSDGGSYSMCFGGR